MYSLNFFIVASNAGIKSVMSWGTEENIGILKSLGQYIILPDKTVLKTNPIN